MAMCSSVMSPSFYFLPVMLRPRGQNFGLGLGLGLEHLASAWSRSCKLGLENVLSIHHFVVRLQSEMWSGTVYAVKLSEYKDMVRHYSVGIKKFNYVCVVGIVAMCEMWSGTNNRLEIQKYLHVASASKTWPRPRCSGLDLGVLASFNIADFCSFSCVIYV